MGQTERVLVLQFEAAAEQFVTAVAEQKTEIERLALLDLIHHIARCFVHRLVSHVHRIKRAEPRQLIAAALHLDSIQVCAGLELDPAFQHRRPSALVAFKEDFPQLDLRPGRHPGPEIEEDIRSVRLPAKGRNLGRGIRKTLPKLVGAQSLNEVLQPKTGVGRPGLCPRHLARGPVVARIHFSRHRSSDRPQALLGLDFHADGAGGIVALQVGHFHGGAFKAFARECSGQVADRTVQPRRRVDAGAFQGNQESDFHKERPGLRG